MAQSNQHQITHLIEELHRLFPKHPCPSGSLNVLSNSSGPDVEDDLSIISGRYWEDVCAEDFRLHFEIPCWLSSSAFHYYLPSIIKASLVELLQKGRLDATDLVVDYVASSYDANGDAWQTFSPPQFEIVTSWLLLLKSRHSSQ